MVVLRYLWAFPITAVGLVLVLSAALTGGKVRWKAGVVEASGGWPGKLLRGSRLHAGGAAMTLGHVILARDETCLEQSRSHELFHVRHFERWGPLLVPAYWLIAGWLRVRGRHPYLDHPMEPPPEGSAEDGS